MGEQYELSFSEEQATLNLIEARNGGTGGLQKSSHSPSNNDADHFDASYARTQMTQMVKAQDSFCESHEEQ